VDGRIRRWCLPWPLNWLLILAADLGR